MPNPKIYISSDYKDKQGLLGKGILEANKILEICSVSDKAKSVIANINIANASTEIVKVDIWLSSNREPSLIDLYESQLELEPNANYNRTTVLLSTGEKIFMRSSHDNVVVRIDGYDNRYL